MAQQSKHMDTVFTAAALIILDGFVLWLVLSGAPFIPTKKEGVKKMLQCCDIKPGMKAADIGSGDGRILIAMAQAGAEAHGFEINPFLVWWSRRKIRQAGLEGKAFVHLQDLWRADFSAFDVVTLFGITHIMGRLEKKLRKELKPGARVVSMAFKFPNWPVESQLEAVYVYRQVV